MLIALLLFGFLARFPRHLLTLFSVVAFWTALACRIYIIAYEYQIKAYKYSFFIYPTQGMQRNFSRIFGVRRGHNSTFSRLFAAGYLLRGILARGGV